LTGSVTHFEIYGEEPAKLADFYRHLFGWQIDQPLGVDYWTIRTEQQKDASFDGGLTY
jgi:predicted enzyme related to lactoylglutathione lyase